MEAKRILIISYYFPPNPGIGSRRWAKYGKVLDQQGVDVHVLCARTKFGLTSAWDDDVQDLKIFAVEPKYPRVLNDWQKKGLFGKIQYRFMNWWVKMRVTGMHYDRAVFWKHTMLKKARSIIKLKNIDVVIVSTPPHRSAYYATQLKEEFPGLKLMVDLRDPWTWGSFREYPSLSGKHRQAEEDMAQEVIDKAETLIVPVEKMQDALIEKYPDCRRKVYLLSSAFDLDDFANIKPKESRDSMITKFIYFGSIYDNLDDHFSQIAEGLKDYSGRFQLDIYSTSDAHKRKFKQAGLKGDVHYHGVLPSNEIFEKVVEADYVFLFKPYEYGKDNVSTKYFEIINTKTPVFIIADRGRASEFIVNNKLGFHSEVLETAGNLKRLMDGNLEIEYDESFKVEEYSFQHQGQKFIEDQLS